MPEANLNVRLLDVTQNAIALVYAACRQCYSPKFSAEFFDEKESNAAKQAAFIKKVVASGHESPLEHAKFTFAVEGVSRALTHQLVRHRLASYCLTGDTMIKGARRQRARSYKKFTLKSLYERTLTPHGRSRLKLIRLNSYDENRKVFDKGKIKNIIYTGKQEVWRIKLADGQNIKATLNHRFFTRDGWFSLGEILHTKPDLGINGIVCQQPAFSLLRDKDWLYEHYNLKNRMQEEIAKEIGCSTHTVRSWVKKLKLQKERGGLHGRLPVRGYHWKLNRKRTSEERAFVSERMKGPNNPMWRGGITREAVVLRRMITPEIRKSVYERDGFQCRLCQKVGGRLTLHHRVPLYVDKTMAAVANNLVTLCRECHRRVNNHETEYKDILGTNALPYHSRSSGCYRMIKWAKIESIECCGVEDTYDMEMESPYHNFVANGFVVHNSQQSQRYVKETNFDYIVPPSIAEDEGLKEEFMRAMDFIQSSYNKLLEAFKDKGQVGERANQDVRFVLPQAAETKIVVTMNCRELIHFFHERCCARAQWEIKRLADAMLKICQKELPEVFSEIDAKCEALGYCPEGEDFTCGKYPLKEKALRTKEPQ